MYDATFARLHDLIGTAHLLHREARRVRRADERARFRYKHHAGVRRFGDAVRELVVHRIRDDDVADADVVGSGANRSDGRVIQLVARRNDAGD